jgi:hypothetical protein
VAQTDREAGHLVRRAVVALGAERVLTHVDSLDLPNQAGAAVLIVAPLRTLRATRDVLSFAKSAPLTAVRAVAEALSADELELIVSSLGDNAAAVARGDEDTLIATTLAVAASHNVPARDHCLRLLSEMSELALPEIEIASPQRGAPTPVDPAVKEARRQRRAADRASRERARSRPAAPNPRSRRPSTRPIPPPPPPAPVTPESIRRQVSLTPLQARRYDPKHPLAGFLVFVDVPFDESSPDVLAIAGKHRPAIVLAGSSTELLARPVYSRPGSTRTTLVGWNRLGLDHPSYVAREPIVISIEGGEAPSRLGRLTDTEWNALF